MEILFTLILFGIPLAVMVWFIASLVMFLSTPKENTEKRKTRKTLLIVSAVIFGIMLLSIIWLTITFAIAITHM